MSKISLLLSSIATMLAKIQGEIKQKQKVEGRENNRRQENGQTRIFFKTALLGYILKKSTHPLFVARPFLLVHILFTPSEGHKSFVI